MGECTCHTGNPPCSWCVDGCCRGCEESHDEVFEDSDRDICWECEEREEELKLVTHSRQTVIAALRKVEQGPEILVAIKLFKSMDDEIYEALCAWEDIEPAPPAPIVPDIEAMARQGWPLARRECSNCGHYAPIDKNQGVCKFQSDNDIKVMCVSDNSCADWTEIIQKWNTTQITINRPTKAENCAVCTYWLNHQRGHVKGTCQAYSNAEKHTNSASEPAVTNYNHVCTMFTGKGQGQCELCAHFNPKDSGCSQLRMEVAKDYSCDGFRGGYAASARKARADKDVDTCAKCLHLNGWNGGHCHKLNIKTEPGAVVCKHFDPGKNTS